MRRGLALVAALVFVAEPGSAQTLSQRVQDLFRFGSCGQPLCLTLTGPLAIHGSHFTGSAVQANENLLGFLTGAIGATLGSIPISSTTSGATFRFVEGAPVSTATSAGPIFAERAQTLGRGRMLLGLNTTRLAFDRVRGTNLDDLSFNFSHQDVQQPGLGDVAGEYDYINVQPSLKLTLLSSAVFATYGLTDRVDVGVAIPVVHASLDGSSTATIRNVNGALSGSHSFGAEVGGGNTATARADGSKTGIGDVALRAKANLSQTDRMGLAILGDARLPTGDADNFTGTGEFALRALGIVSGRFGAFSPHANGGFAFRSGDQQTNAVLFTAGFDQLLSPRATLAIDAITEWQTGDSKLTLPRTIQFAGTNASTLPATDIPDRKDNIINLSAGAKFTFSGATIIVNGILPLGDGGMQSKTGMYTLGVERTFR